MSDRVRVDSFTEFVEVNETPVRRALTAAFGSEVGREAAADAFAYAWQHWDRIKVMDNPVGYLYQAGRNQARTMSSKKMVEHLDQVASRMPWIEPELPTVLANLSEQQRTVVALIHSYEWSMAEVASVLGISKGSVQTHERRAMKRLRRGLGVPE